MNHQSNASGPLSRAADHLPSFSIVVPTHRRVAALARLLRGLAKLDYPAERREVLVVDDGGGLRREHLPAEVAALPGMRLLSQEHAGPAAARNRGAAAAQGDCLAFIDDDCQPHRSWLRHLAQGLTRRPRAACGGAVINRLVHNRYSQASQMVVDHLYQHLNTAGGRAGFLASNNLAVGRRDFWAVGGFDTAFSFAGAEDRHFCRRWIDSGRHLVYLPQAVVNHFHHLDLRGFLRQHMRYGRGSQLLRRRCGSADFFEPSFYLSLVGRGIRQRSGLRGLQLSALLLAAQAATAGGYLAQGLRLARAAARQPGAVQAKPPVGE